MADRTLSVNLFANVQGYVRGMDEVARKTRETTKTIEQQSADQQAAYERVGAAAVLVGGAVVTALGMAAKAAIDWESAWAGVLKTVDASPAQFAALEGELRDLAGVLPATHAEIAAVAEAAGQLGIQVDNIPEFTRVMIDMGESTNLSSDQAATSLARFMNVMGTAQDEVGNLGSAVVALGNNYATTEAEIVEMSQRLSGAGVQVGFTEGEVLGLATALSSVGIEAEAGGSAISKVMIDIAASVDEGGERLGMFAEVAGMSADAFAEKWSTDPGAALSAFVEGLANAESQGRSTLGILADLGITEVRMRDALLRSAAASDQFTEAMQAGNDAYAEGTALAEEAGRRYETLAAQIDITRNKVVDAAISFGETLAPAVAGVVAAVGEFADFMGALPGPVQVGITVIAGLAGGVTLLGGVALVAVPQIVAFQGALATLGVTAGTTSAAVGGLAALLANPAVLGVVAAVAGLGAIANALEETQPKVDEYAAALERGADAADLLNLANQGFLNQTDGFEFDTENVGSYLDQLDRIRESNGWAAFLPENWEVQFTDFNSRIRQIDEALGQMSPEAARQGFDELVEGLGLTDAQAEQLLGRMEATAGVLGDAEDAASDAAGGIEGVGDAASVAADSLASLVEQQQSANDEFFAATDATSAYEQAVDDIADAFADAAANNESLAASWNETTNSFDLGSQAGRDANETMRSLVETGNAHIQMLIDTNAPAEQVRDAQERLRGEVEQVAGQFGATGEQAEAYTGLILDIPDSAYTNVQLETAAAERALAAFINRRRIVRVDVDVNGMPSGTMVRPGQVGMFAGGGRIPGYAPGYDDRVGFLRDGSVVGLGGGEFIMPTRMTDRYLPMLEQMRAGQFPGYAGGGRIQYAQAAPVVNVTAPAGGGRAPIEQHNHFTEGMSPQAAVSASMAALNWEMRGA